MAELKNYVMAVVAILFIATVAVSLYSTALTNNLASGGNGTSIAFPLLNQTTAYTEQMTNFSNQFAKSTGSASSTQSTGWDALSGGIGALTQAGTGAISLTFNSITILISMMGSFAVSLGPMGVPPIIFAFGILSITIGIVFAILAALYKWWI